MIIKGGSRGGGGGGARLARHLSRRDTNELVKLRELYGVAAGDLPGALEEMTAVASGTRCKKPLYHASINVPVGEQMTPEQWLYAVNRLGHELGLDGQPRAVVEHVKEGRQHIHVVWSRIDVEQMKAISDSHNYRIHEAVSRQLEKEFGHERVEGVHGGDKTKERPVAEISPDEQQQAERTGLPVRQVKADMTAAWESTATGQEFADAIGEQGYVLAQGDKRAFVVIDAEGGLHNPRRRIEGVKAADIKERFADLDPADLPTVDEARAIVADREREQPPAGGDREEDSDASSAPPEEEGEADSDAGAWERARRLFHDWTDKAKELFSYWRGRLLEMIRGEEKEAPEARDIMPWEKPAGERQDKEATKPRKVEREPARDLMPWEKDGEGGKSKTTPKPAKDDKGLDGKDPHDRGGRDD